MVLFTIRVQEEILITIKVTEVKQNAAIEDGRFLLRRLRILSGGR